MFIVLLLLFQSICLYCRRLVLKVHDKWINPTNVRLQIESTPISGKNPLRSGGNSGINNNNNTQNNNSSSRSTNNSRSYRRSTTRTDSSSTAGFLSAEGGGGDSCRFCANSPQGYCRHHFHLQELQLQQKHHQRTTRHWPLMTSMTSSLPSSLSLSVFSSNSKQEQREVRKLNRELKKYLKNRLCEKSLPTVQLKLPPTPSTYTNIINHQPSPPLSTYNVEGEFHCRASSNTTSDCGGVDKAVIDSSCSSCTGSYDNKGNQSTEAISYSSELTLPITINS